MSHATDSALNDKALVRAAADGDRAAFEALYRRHVDRVYGVLLRLSGYNRARAEDLLQDAFVRAWQKLGSFRHESTFATWLYRLAVNTALMSLRADKADPVKLMDEAAIADSEVVPFCPAERAELERAIAGLPNRARAVFVLHDIEGWRHQDISAHLGMAVGTSKAQLHRARRLLQHALEET